MTAARPAGGGSRVIVCADPAAVAAQAATILLEAGRGALERAGRFDVALSGGSTPLRMYRALAECCGVGAIEGSAGSAAGGSAGDFAGDSDGDSDGDTGGDSNGDSGGDLAPDSAGRLDVLRSAHFFWGDERCVPIDHPDSNFGAARDALIAPLSIAHDHVHRVRTELEVPVEMASDYTRQIAEHFGRVVATSPPAFDLILLGMGEDGHTASLFPDTKALREERAWVVDNWVFRLEAHRITFTLPLINAAAMVLVLVTGDAKAGKLRDALRGAAGGIAPPIAGVRPRGELLWLVDEAAASALHDGHRSS